MTYEATTHGVTVQVTPQFLETESDTTKNKYIWAYHIKIINTAPHTVQLLNRYWRITDARGQTQEVRGAGVIGEQPVLNPDEFYEYTSGVPLGTPSGFMGGHYEMITADGIPLDITVPTFSLDSPYDARVLN